MLKLTVSAIFLALCVCTQTVSAFMPDDQELSTRLSKAYGPLTSWEAEVTFPDHPGTSVAVHYARGLWRQEWSAGETAVAVGKAGSVTAACTGDGFPLSPLFVWMVSEPLDTWRSWGVDTASRSYGFSGESPCIILGAQPADHTAPAVYLDNETMAPLMVRYVAEGNAISVTFSHYTTVGGYSVPERVVLLADDQLVEMAVTWKSVMGADSEALYARDSVQAVPCTGTSFPFVFLRDNYRYPTGR